ncbi:MAG: TIGR02453 family protein [Chloroflexota bacterium]
MTKFTGFSQTGINFLAELAQNNNREWFTEHKDVYKSEIVTPALALITELGERLKMISPGINADKRTNGGGSLMRIYRDTRFSKNKTPYKTNLGIFFWEGSSKKMECPGFYFHIEPNDMWIGAGLYIFPKAVLAPYREAVDDEKKGMALQEIVTELQEKGYIVDSIDKYKRIPRDYPKDHPRADLLKYKGIFGRIESIPIESITSADLIDVCYDHCVAVSPLHKWLVTNLPV